MGFSSLTTATHPKLLPRYILLDARQDRAQQSLEAASDPLAGFHHFLMGERLIEYSRRHIGDARDREHFDLHVTRGNYLKGG